MLRPLALVLLMSACVGPEADDSSASALLRPVARRPAPAIVKRPACEAQAAIALTPPGARRLAEVQSIAATVTLTRPCATQQISVELISPRGKTFEVRQARLHGASAATFTFPVAGAAIALRGLSGPWQLRAFADGAPVSPQSFELDR